MKFVTAADMCEIDRRAIEEFGIPSLLLMENAGIACAGEVMRLSKLKKCRVVIFCGKGNNGGDGFAAARQLANQGYPVHVFYFERPSAMKQDPAVHFRILEKMKVPLSDCSEKPDWQMMKEVLRRSKIAVDALFGTGLSKPVEGLWKSAIELINEAKVRVVAVDIPSGLNADTGEVMGACIRAKVTVALGLPKKAFAFKQSKRYTGRIVIADISIPKKLLVF